MQLIPTFAPETRQISFLNISGVAVRSNKTDGFFNIDAAQYTTNYKTNRNLSVLPVRMTFNSNKYKNKKPIPSNNTYVSVEGVLYDFETDTNGQATRFWLSVDNISFLGRASTLPSTSASPSSRGLPFFILFFFFTLTNSMTALLSQTRFRHLLHHAASNTALTFLICRLPLHRLRLLPSLNPTQQQPLQQRPLLCLFLDHQHVQEKERSDPCFSSLSDI